VERGIGIRKYVHNTKPLSDFSKRGFVPPLQLNFTVFAFGQIYAAPVGAGGSTPAPT